VDGWPEGKQVNWPDWIDAYVAAMLAALNDVERMCNEHRDDWIDVRGGDDAQYQLAMGEAQKWEAVAAFIRAITGGVQDV
jgi:hypothetical protein